MTEATERPGDEYLRGRLTTWDSWLGLRQTRIAGAFFTVGLLVLVAVIVLLVVFVGRVNEQTDRNTAVIRVICGNTVTLNILVHASIDNLQGRPQLSDGEQKQLAQLLVSVPTLKQRERFCTKYGQAP